MNTPAIQVSRLSKSFKVWRRPGDILTEALTGRKKHDEFTALSDITFEVGKGEVVGIMGRNGAGKSTLLRIVAGTLDASTGRADVSGRVSAILELGTGFHPEYSGRENIFLGGMCLGLSKQEIKERYDEIVSFSELADFIDRPFRTYSSGMQARLTFAVATSIDPDVLIIDEALSVGDARFQLKSFDRVRDFQRRGKSILFVSHDPNAVTSICDRAILLEKGHIHSQGLPGAIGNIYHELLFGSSSTDVGPSTAHVPASAAGGRLESKAAEKLSTLPAGGEAPKVGVGNGEPITPAEGNEWTVARPSMDAPTITSDREHRYGLSSARIVDVQIKDGARSVNQLVSLQAYTISIEIEASSDTGPLHLGFLIRTSRGLTVFGWDTGSARRSPLPALKVGQKIQPKVGFVANFAAGRYFLTAALAKVDGTKEDVRFDVLEMVVEGTPNLHTDSIVNIDVDFDDIVSAD